jgi:hypothetical protein
MGQIRSWGYVGSMSGLAEIWAIHEYEKLEMMNRILTDAARERAGECQVVQLESARKRARELEVVAAERANLLNEKDKELALVRETLTKCLFRNRDLEQALAEIGRK